MTRNRDLGDVAPFVDGVSSNIQTQIDAKQGTISVTADRALISDGSGALAVSTVTSTQLATVPNLAPIANPTFTGVVTTPQVNVTAQGSVRMEDAAGGEYAAFQAPTTLTASYIMTMPPNTGSTGQFLQTNGSGVLSFAAVPASSGGLLSVQIFTSSGTWTKPAGVTKIKVMGVGGGGSGGEANWSQEFSGGGGGGGGYFDKFMDVSSISSVTVTIGAGAAGTNNHGQLGGNTTFGSYCTGEGGSGGRSTYDSSNGAEGGSATGGDMNTYGGGGGAGAAAGNAHGVNFSGQGGASFFGGGGRGCTRYAQTTAAAAYGSGGSGGAANGTGTQKNGNAGQNGIIIVEEYS